MEDEALEMIFCDDEWDDVRYRLKLLEGRQSLSF